MGMSKGAFCWRQEDVDLHSNILTNTIASIAEQPLEEDMAEAEVEFTNKLGVILEEGTAQPFTPRRPPALFEVRQKYP